MLLTIREKAIAAADAIEIKLLEYIPNVSTEIMFPIENVIQNVKREIRKNVYAQRNSVKP